MNVVLQFVLKHGYAILFAAVFAHQLGLPLPGPLFLLAAGALAATGKLGVIPALGLAVLACVLADWVWYEAGRRRGDKVLHFIHRLTSDPDFHDRRAKETFAHFGLALLVVAKFVPGLDAVTPPLAGTSRTSRPRFLAFDVMGATLYSTVYAGLGYVFRHDLNHAAAYAGRAGTILACLVAAGVVICAVRKPVWRQRLIGDLRRGLALLKAGIAEARPRIAVALTDKCALMAYWPVPWPMFARFSMRQEEELISREIKNAAR
jgi:membrane protein DedA with SNARE-associated domain